jgi:hypothetical protein
VVPLMRSAAAETALSKCTRSAILHEAVASRVAGCRERPSQRPPGSRRFF